MRREDRFLMSRRPYAVDLGSLSVSEHGHSGLAAVWYRRRQGVTYACIGELRTYLRPAPTTAAEFLARHDDGRYGGDCFGRWDGSRYWGAQAPAVMEAHLAVLRPMLDGFPTVMPGYDGWWTFAPLLGTKR